MFVLGRVKGLQINIYGFNINSTENSKKHQKDLWYKGEQIRDWSQSDYKHLLYFQVFY